MLRNLLSGFLDRFGLLGVKERKVERSFDFKEISDWGSEG